MDIILSNITGATLGAGLLIFALAIYGVEWYIT